MYTAIRWICLAALLLGPGTSLFPAFSQVIHPSRTIVWAGSGVAGGIPDRRDQVDCVNDAYAGKKAFYLNHEGDNRPAISACIDSLSAGQVAYLPPGHYRMDSELVIRKSDITLRGQGPDRTVLDYRGGGASYLQFTGTSTFDPPPHVASWTAGYTKGTTTITVSSAAGLSPGSVIVLDQLDDNRTLAFTNGGSGAQFSRDAGTRHVNQTAVVTAISGDTVSIDTPLFIDYSSEQSPEAYWWDVSVSNSGVEDLGITTVSAQEPDLANYNIFIQYAKNVWVRNIESNLAGRAHVRTFRVHRAEIRDSYFHHSRSYGSSSYGIEIWNASSSLIENNALDSVTAPILLAAGASGNVIAYNYIHSVRYDPSPAWLPETMSAHAGHDLMNLFEGNFAPNLYLDNIWGSNSHTTAFRNRLTGWQSGKSLNTHAVSMEAHSRHNNIVGNILGTDRYHSRYESPFDAAYDGSDAVFKLGYWTTNSRSLAMYDTEVYNSLLRHANYDTVNDAVLYCDTDGGPGCHGGDRARTIPDSLYLEGRPDWFGDCVWPPFDPVGAAEHTLPAQKRFQSATCASESGGSER